MLLPFSRFITLIARFVTRPLELATYITNVYSVDCDASEPQALQRTENYVALDWDGDVNSVGSGGFNGACSGLSKSSRSMRFFLPNGGGPMSFSMSSQVRVSRFNSSSASCK